MNRQSFFIKYWTQCAIYTKNSELLKIFNKIGQFFQARKIRSQIVEKYEERYKTKRHSSEEPEPTSSQQKPSPKGAKKTRIESIFRVKPFTSGS